MKKQKQQEFDIRTYDNGVLLGVVESWVCPMENEPPLNTEILAKDPNGNIHLTTWRESYGIFSCQGKSEGVYGWFWKNI